jgi:hypothetical protein
LKNFGKKIATVAVLGALTIGGLAACAPTTSEYDERKAAQGNSQIVNSLEKKNLEKKRDKEEDANAIRYVYLMNYGNITGYYVIEGKVSSSGSQIGPEEEIVKRWSDGYVLDSAQDDGTYGTGDPGVFFFTTDGMMVETSLDYVISDRPMTLDVPRLGGDAPAKK